MSKYTRNECVLDVLRDDELVETCLSALEMIIQIGEEHQVEVLCDLFHSFRVYFMILNTLVSSVFYDLLHSFRVYFMIFSTRFECIL